MQTVHECARCVQLAPNSRVRTVIFANWLTLHGRLIIVNSLVKNAAQRARDPPELNHHTPKIPRSIARGQKENFEMME